jgi:NADH-quinone oxidoreductase subunit A
VLQSYAAAMDAAYGGYFTLGRLFARMIGNPTVMKQATRYGLPRAALMRFMLKLMANLTDPHDGDVSDRIINALSKVAPDARGRRETGQEDDVELYTPVIYLAAIAAGFAVFSVIMSVLAGPRRYNRAKLDSYECGIEPTPQPVGGGRVPIKYFITAMMFIVFDIEIVFLYPWAVSFDAMGMFGLVEMVTFIVTVLIAYAYVWRRGGLDWD